MSSTDAVLVIFDDLRAVVISDDKTGEAEYLKIKVKWRIP
jgi:hypothetical protein